MTYHLTSTNYFGFKITPKKTDTRHEFFINNHKTLHRPEAEKETLTLIETSEISSKIHKKSIGTNNMKLNADFYTYSSNWILLEVTQKQSERKQVIIMCWWWWRNPKKNIEYKLIFPSWWDLAVKTPSTRFNGKSGRENRNPLTSNSLIASKSGSNKNWSKETR